MTPSEIYTRAHVAGMVALKDVIPTPMIVGQPATPFGNDIDFSKPTHYVEGGCCGFAWINIKPARGKFVSWLKKNGIGRTDSYNGGYTIWVSEGGQSMTRKESYATAFAEVLRENGLRAYMNSRID